MKILSVSKWLFVACLFFLNSCFVLQKNVEIKAKKIPSPFVFKLLDPEPVIRLTNKGRFLITCGKFLKPKFCYGRYNTTNNEIIISPKKNGCKCSTDEIYTIDGGILIGRSMIWRIID